jgi:hypothetical protein
VIFFFLQLHQAPTGELRPNRLSSFT